jgi:atrazine chlorohydrolase/5-methylthioadenosine/S-adenosylhomocysteine deaminase/melamine deaminase
VATLNPVRPHIDDAVVLVDGHHIAAVGSRAEVTVPPEADVVDATGCAIIPGFVNCHTHVPQILLRGGPSGDRNLFDWLFTALYPGLAEYGPDDIACAYRLYCLEALRAGVTTIVANDHVGHADYLAAAEPAIRALDDSGIRALYGRMFSDSVPAGSDALFAAVRARRPDVKQAFVRRDTDSVLADLDRLLRAYDGRSDGRIRVIPSPSTASATSVEALRACDRIARERSGIWTLHVSETPSDRPTPQLSAVEHLAAHGLLSSRLLAGHCVHVDRRDIRLLSRAGVAVSTQPVSNGVLGSGIAPVPDLVSAGVRVGLGTDDANCNDTVNPLADLKTLGVLQRAQAMDVSAASADELLRLATLGGAEALGLADEIGSLEEGKRADLCVLSLRAAHLTPAPNLAAALVWQANGSEVRDVMVDGELVLRDRRARFLEREGGDAEGHLLDDAAARARRIVTAAGLC